MTLILLASALSTSALALETATIGPVPNSIPLGATVPQSFPDCAEEEVWFDGACRDFAWLLSPSKVLIP